jgi:hypothetical protein
MQTELNHTVKSLFGRVSLDEMSKDDLFMLTTKYPYSAILHFLYTRKLQSSHDLRYPASVAKTALYFSNPHWLHHQLRAKTSVEALAEMEMAFEKSHAGTSEVGRTTIEHIHNWIESQDTPPMDEEVIEPVQDVKDVFPEMHFESDNLSEIPQDDFTPSPEEVVETEIFSPEHKQTELVEDTAENMLESIPEPIPENTVLPEPLIDFPPSIEENEIIDQEPAALENIVDKKEPEIFQEMPAEIIDEPINEITLPAAIQEPEIMEIPLEPLYAVDYFASQGIRLREEDQQDPLGKKLKSFTEWLKSMKKVHPEKSKGQMDEKTEAAIKSEAELSNDKADVLTETMAEVFIKQGLTQKAIDVYEKLSLLDPLKSATFAAKISELKAQ